MKIKLLVFGALTLAMTGCKDAKNNGENADTQQTEEKQEQNVKGSDEQEGKIFDADNDSKVTEQEAEEQIISGFLK